MTRDAPERGQRQVEADRRRKGGGAQRRSPAPAQKHAEVPREVRTREALKLEATTRAEQTQPPGTTLGVPGRRPETMREALALRPETMREALAPRPETMREALALRPEREALHPARMPEARRARDRTPPGVVSTQHCSLEAAGC